MARGAAFFIAVALFPAWTQAVRQTVLTAEETLLEHQRAADHVDGAASEFTDETASKRDAQHRAGTASDITDSNVNQRDTEHLDRAASGNIDVRAIRGDAEHLEGTTSDIRGGKAIGRDQHQRDVAKIDGTLVGSTNASAGWGGVSTQELMDCIHKQHKPWHECVGARCCKHVINTEYSRPLVWLQWQYDARGHMTDYHSRKWVTDTCIDEPYVTWESVGWVGDDLCEHPEKHKGDYDIASRGRCDERHGTCIRNVKGLT